MNKTFNVVCDGVYFSENQIVDEFKTTARNVQNIKICNIDDVSLNPDENFYYIITKIGEYLNFTHEIDIVNTIPTNIKECFIKNKNFKIIFLELNESDFDDIIEIVDYRLKKENLDPSRVYYINANHKLEKLKIKNNSDLNVYTINHGQHANCQRLSFTDVTFEPNKEFLFMVHNRSLKSHRLGILCLLKKYDVLENVDWSLLRAFQIKNLINSDGNIVDWFFQYVFNEDMLMSLKNEINYFSNFEIKKSKYEEDFSFDDLVGHTYDHENAYKVKTYSTSYINITTETNFESENIIHITEKTFTPFNFYQIPIFVATYQHVKYLRDMYNLDMFDDLVNHDYDSEPNNQKRLIMIANEVKRLSENPKIIRDFYLNNKDRFYKNRDIIFKIVEDKKDHNFFQSLI
jgi:hypothetical protein